MGITGLYTLLPVARMREVRTVLLPATSPSHVYTLRTGGRSGSPSSRRRCKHTHNSNLDEKQP